MPSIITFFKRGINVPRYLVAILMIHGAFVIPVWAQNTKSSEEKPPLMRQNEDLSGDRSRKDQRKASGQSVTGASSFSENFLEKKISGDELNPPLPRQILLFQDLAQEYRQKIGFKFSDITKTYAIRENTPGIIEFLDEDEDIVLRIEFQHSIKNVTPGSQEMIEWVKIFRIHGKESHVIVEEKVVTQGQNLVYTRPADVIFFQGPGRYHLSSNEEHKEVTVRSEYGVLFRFTTHRSRSPGGQKSIVTTQVIYGNLRVFDVRDTIWDQERQRTLEYLPQSPQFALVTPQSRRETAGIKLAPFRVYAKKDPRLVTTQYSYFMDEHEIFGLNTFLSEFNDHFYTTYLVNGLNPFVQDAIIDEFPETLKRINLGLRNRFLDDLIRLRRDVDLARTQPSILTRISAEIAQIIAAIQEGELVIQDFRPVKP